MEKILAVLKNVIRKIKECLRIKSKNPECTPRAGSKIPKVVLEQFEYYLGKKVDPYQIVVFPDNGYEHYKHGKFDLYVIRRDGTLYCVYKYHDGTVR